MTKLNQIFVKGRQPLFLSEQLSNWLRNTCRISNIVELYGPAIHNDKTDVYGYYIPNWYCIVRPADMWSEDFDIETLSSEFGPYEAVRYVMDFECIVRMKIREFCNIDKNDHDFIIEQGSDESNDAYFARLSSRAMRFY